VVYWRLAGRKMGEFRIAEITREVRGEVSDVMARREVRRSACREANRVEGIILMYRMYLHSLSNATILLSECSIGTNNEFTEII